MMINADIRVDRLSIALLRVWQGYSGEDLVSGNRLGRCAIMTNSRRKDQMLHGHTCKQLFSCLQLATGCVSIRGSPEKSPDTCFHQISNSGGKSGERGSTGKLPPLG